MTICSSPWADCPVYPDPDEDARCPGPLRIIRNSITDTVIIQCDTDPEHVWAKRDMIRLETTLRLQGLKKRNYSMGEAT